MSAQAKSCERCGRRYADRATLEDGRCPSCGGGLVPIDEGPYPDPPQKAS
jgi:rRNA maturation endonuclease Nob1